MQSGAEGKEKEQIQRGRNIIIQALGSSRHVGLKVTFNQRLSPASPALEREERFLKSKRDMEVPFSLNDRC